MNEMNFYISDTHFGHANVVNYPSPKGDGLLSNGSPD